MLEHSVLETVETAGESKGRVLGGGDAKRWNDKHVTQNGNNQAPITDPHVRVRASHSALDDTR